MAQYTQAILPKDYDWQEVYRIPINRQAAESDEKLVDTASLAGNGIFTRSDYAAQQIPGALPSCYVRASSAERLGRAAERLPEGIHLLILDGWRPIAVQQELINRFGLEIARRYAHLPAEERAAVLSRFVAAPSADPAKPSPHSTGGSVDLTLCDSDGRPLPMGTAFDAPVDDSWTGKMEEAGKDLQARDNRRLLYGVMTEAGFTNLPSEWWHFDYGNQLWAYFSGKREAFYTITSLPGHPIR